MNGASRPRITVPLREDGSSGPGTRWRRLSCPGVQVQGIGVKGFVLFLQFQSEFACGSR